MLSNEDIDKFYPQLSSRILLYLRKYQNHDSEIKTSDIIQKFKKSKSIISQVLMFLTEHQYIKREYVANINDDGSRHRISITEKGLKVAEGILSEGLNVKEMKALKISKLRKRRR